MPRPAGAEAVQMLLEAVQKGKLTPASARTWARRAAGGEDIGIIRVMGAMPSREVYGARSMGALQAELVNILASAGATATAGPDVLAMDEYDQLFTDQEARRDAEVRKAVARVERMSDAEVYDVLFGPTDGTG